MEILGEIKAITSFTRNGKEKKEVHLQTQNDGLVFIEFQGWRVDHLKGYHEGHKVKISAYYNGSTSKLGVNYNNVVATKIQSV